MKKIILILACILAAKSLLAQPQDLISLPDSSASPATRQLAYEKLRIDKIDGSMAFVSGTAYNKADLLGLYTQAGAEGALRDIKSSQHLDEATLIAPSATLADGLIIGTTLGLLSWWWSGIRETQDSGDFFPTVNYSDSGQRVWNMRPYLAWGAGIGAAFAGIEYLSLQRHSQTVFERSTQRYNQSLRDRLQISVVPQPGGAKAGASLRF